ncbi:hypothetical protein D9M72_376070 [compost metagenome]|jgi:hypothetical protein
MVNDDETALTLQEAAARLNLSYSTVFAQRQRIGFRLPGSRVWRVWPSRLAALTEKRSNLTRLHLRVSGDTTCPSTDVMMVKSGGRASARQAARELDNLLAQRTKKPLRNTKTG